MLEGELDPAKKEEFLQWRGVFSCHGLLMGDPLYVIPNLENQSIFVTFYYVTTFKELKSGIDY